LVIKQLKESNYWEEITSKIDCNKLVTSKDIEKLYVYVNGYKPECPFNKHIKFIGYAVGYRRCGPASRCKCTEQSVSDNVSRSKLSYSNDTKSSINEKRKQTNIERYGIDNPFKDQDKVKESYIAKLGVDHPMHLDSTKDKIKSTNIERYGVDHPMHLDSTKDKIKSTNIERYGVDHPMHLDSIKDKIKSTNIERYGVDHPMHLDSIKDKIKSTSLEKYGVDNPSKSEIIKQQIRTAQLDTYYSKLCSRLEIHKIRPNDQEPFNFTSNHFKWICDTCNSHFDGTAINGRIPRCPTCYPAHISSGQQEIVDYIKGIVGVDPLLINDRTVLANKNDKRKNKELDIVIKDKNLAIEYCGLRYHTEGFGNKNKFYHYNKWYECNNKNIQLITIFSDDWYDNKLLIKSMINVRLGKSAKIPARKTIVSVIDNYQAEEFFENNHISGYIKSSYNIGLFYENKLVMCMSFSKSRYNKSFEFEITRMAAIRNTVVVGGASKLFSYFVKNKNPNSVISYCDLSYGTGKSYLKMGFASFGKPTIGYQYVELNKPNCRYDRLQFQKHKLGETNGLTEKQFMLSNGFDVIWDCGHQKYIWKKS